jgi:thioester reductase-like protein
VSEPGFTVFLDALLRPRWRQLADIRSCICHSRPHSTMAPPLRLATVPVIALASTDAVKTATSASSASVVRRSDPRVVAELLDRN